MTLLTGYTSALPTDVILGSLVLAIDSATIYGATQGEPIVHIPHEFENLDFDGKMIPMVGLDRRVYSDVYIEGTFMELNSTKLLDLEPAGASATASSVETITPGLLGEFLVAGNYKENVRAFMRTGANAIICVEFNYGLLRVESITGSGASKGAVKVRFDARQDTAAASLGVAPYVLKKAATIAAIVAADP